MMASNKLHNMDLGTLRSFSIIAETGSMTRAATKLYMTQSAISMQIKRLESSLGLSVFDRSVQGMTPTLEGEKLLHFAHQMLAINDEAMARLTSPDYEGQISLAVPADVIYPHIPEILKAFNRDYPRVRVNFSNGGTFNIKDKFRRGKLDLVLTTENIPSEGGRVIATKALLWMGAENGCAWKRRPLPLGVPKNCAFRSGILSSLDKAKLDWTDLVESDDCVIGEAMTAADLCIIAELEGANLSGRVAIEHNGQLPELAEISIVLYGGDSPSNQLTQTLVEYIIREFS